MRAAAKFQTILPYFIHPYFITILLFKKSDCATFLSLLNRDVFVGNWESFCDLVVDHIFNLLLFLFRHLTLKAEIKAQTLRRNVTPFLKHLLPEHIAKRLVEQVCGGVIFDGHLTVVRKAPFEFLLRTRTGRGAMFFHLSVETYYVNADVSLFRKFHGYFKRKPISGKKHKSVSAGDIFSGKFFKSGKTFGEGLPEFLLFNRNDVFNLD